MKFTIFKSLIYYFQPTYYLLQWHLTFIISIYIRPNKMYLTDLKRPECASRRDRTRDFTQSQRATYSIHEDLLSRIFETHCCLLNGSTCLERSQVHWHHSIQATSSDYVVSSTYTGAEWSQNHHKVKLLLISSFSRLFAFFFLILFVQITVQKV
jgi:hypothetical protein